MRILMMAIAALFFLNSCSQTSGQRKTPNGLEVKVLRDGKGEYAAPGQFLVLSMVYKDSKDSVWDDTRKRGIPMLMPVGDTSAIKNEKGVESVFRILKKNDSVQVTVTAKSLFENTWGQPLPAKVKPEENITFVISCSQVLDRSGADSLWQIIQSRRQELAQEKAVKQLGADSVAIDAYLASKNIVALKGPSGTRYVVTRKGSGAAPSIESTLTFSYKGMLLETGAVFDQSTSPVVYPLSQLIRGWQLVFPSLGKGSKATLYIPSSLGYGAAGSPPVIPPDSNLIFEVELIDFK